MRMDKTGSGSSYTSTDSLQFHVLPSRNISILQHPAVVTASIYSNKTSQRHHTLSCAGSHCYSHALCNIIQGVYLRSPCNTYYNDAFHQRHEGLLHVSEHRQVVQQIVHVTSGCGVGMRGADHQVPLRVETAICLPQLCQHLQEYQTRSARAVSDSSQ